MLPGRLAEQEEKQETSALWELDAPMLVIFCRTKAVMFLYSFALQN